MARTLYPEQTRLLMLHLLSDEVDHETLLLTVEYLVLITEIL